MSRAARSASSSHWKPMERKPMSRFGAARNLPLPSISENSTPWRMAESSSLEQGFYHRTRGARKIMVLDLGFLGDTVHLLPALWEIRQAYPAASLHVMVAEHV